MTVCMDACMLTPFTKHISQFVNTQDCRIPTTYNNFIILKEDNTVLVTVVNMHGNL